LQGGPHGVGVLPARFDHSGKVPTKCQLPEAETAELELPQKATRPAATLAAVVLSHLELWGLSRFCNVRCSRHIFLNPVL